MREEKKKFVVPPLGGPSVENRLKAGLRTFSSSSGFTLVELIVVLSIIAILVTISVPAVASFTSPKETLRKQGRRVMRLMNEARSVAMSRKVRVDIRIDPVMNEIRAVESQAYRELMAVDPIDREDEEWLLAMTNRFEKTLTFDTDFILEGFSIEQIEVPSADDDPFQRLEEEDEGFQTLEDPEAEVLALTFTHFGGSDGGGITLRYKETSLNMAADILTGRPRIVNLIGLKD